MGELRVTEEKEPCIAFMTLSDTNFIVGKLFAMIPNIDNRIKLISAIFSSCNLEYSMYFVVMLIYHWA